MIIKSLSISNFRQYKERATIHFAQNKEANITLILGNNTSGKSTILQAFLWCMYGHSKLTFDSKDRLFNEEVAYQMKNGQEEEIEVSLKLTHSKTDYIIKRTQKFVKQFDRVKLKGQSIVNIYYKNEEGETDEVKPINTSSVIEDILPSEISEYFFYDTERFGNITDKRDVTNAVKGLLGLTILENALSHLGSTTRSGTVLGELYKELNHDQNKTHQQLINEIDKLNQEIDINKKLINNHENNKLKYENWLKDEKEKLRSLESTMRIQEEIDQKQKRSMRLRQEEMNEKVNFLKEFRRDTLEFFMKPLLNITVDLVSNSDIKEEFIRGMNSDSIDDIVKRGYCICGTKIKEQSIEYYELQKALKVIPPQSIGGLVDGYKILADHSLHKGEHLKPNLEEIDKKISNITIEANNLDDEISTLEKQIKTKIDGKAIQESIENYEQKLKKIDQQIFNLNVSNQTKQNEIETKRNQINKFIQINEKNKEIMTLLKYAEKVTDWFRDDYENEQSQIREQLENKVNHYFQQIYHGNRLVKINDKYKVSLVDKNNTELRTDESAGLETVKNFSFIAGLVELAKEKLVENNKKNQQEDIVEEYPLILDAPFSNVDEEHVVNISKTLPKVAGQLVLIVMEKDWDYAAKELTNRVGKTFKLEKHSEIFTSIKEV